jgi:quercetin dioxygenase-like cupin family protein
MLTAHLPFESQTVFNVMGTRCRTLVSGEMTDRTLAIVQVEVDQPGTGVPEHTHRLEDEVFHVLSGKIRLTVAGKSVDVAAGQSAFGPRGVPHSWVALEPTVMVVSVTPSGLDEMFADLDALGSDQSDLANVIRVCAGYDIHFATV